MTSSKQLPLTDWFSNCGGWKPKHQLALLRRGIQTGMVNLQDEFGMTALCLCVASGWQDGVETLLAAGADTEMRYFRTGETALYMAVQAQNEPIIVDLVDAGAKPDAPNYWGITPRDWALRNELTYFDHIPIENLPLPQPRIQNAEHLADHYHPRFKIPSRGEREAMEIGQAVDLYVYGPKSEAQKDVVKARITSVDGVPPNVRYTATVETPLEQTHLGTSDAVIEFAPEHIASVYSKKPSSKTGRTKR